MHKLGSKWNGHHRVCYDVCLSVSPSVLLCGVLKRKQQNEAEKWDGASALKTAFKTVTSKQETLVYTMAFHQPNHRCPPVTTLV